MGLFMGKARVIVKFAAACVGSGVATGVKVYSLGAAGGREIVGISKSSISSFAEKITGIAPSLIYGNAEKRDKKAFQPSVMSIKPRPQRAKREKQPPASKSPRRKDKLPVASSVPLNPKLDQLEIAIKKVAEDVQQRVAEAFTAERHGQPEEVRHAQEGDSDQRDRLLEKQGETLAKIVEELKDTRDLVRKDSLDTNSSKE